MHPFYIRKGHVCSMCTLVTTTSLVVIVVVITTTTCFLLLLPDLQMIMIMANYHCCMALQCNCYAGGCRPFLLGDQCIFIRHAGSITTALIITLSKRYHHSASSLKLLLPLLFFPLVSGVCQENGFKKSLCVHSSSNSAFFFLSEGS